MTPVLEIEGLWLMILAAAAAGLTRGFTGFGTAMVFMPVAGAVVGPVWAVTAMTIMDLFGPLPAVPRALRDGHPRDLIIICAGAVFALPFGLWLLTSLDADLIRTVVSLAALILVALLIAGVRYRGRVTAPVLLGTGSVSGVLGGATGLGGPPVILFYMASPHPAAVIRANTLLYLLLLDILLIGGLYLSDALVSTAMILGVVLILPYLTMVAIGSRLFRPEYERVYRRLAYAIIALSALAGLPIWG